MRKLCLSLLETRTPGKGAATALLAAALVLAGGGSAWAAAKSWNVSTGNWSLPSNWSPSGVPSTTDTVTVATGTLTIDIPASVTSLTISGGTVGVSGASTTIKTSGNFNVSGGTFTSGTAAGNTITVQGGVTVSNTDSSLVGYWKLDESSTSAADSSSTGATLTWGGSPTASTSVPTVGFADPYSLTMTGSQYAASSTLNAALQPATVTMSAWYKATSVDTSGAEILSGANIYALRVTTGGLSVIKRIAHNGTITDQEWVEYQVVPSGHLNGNWHQIVGVINPDHSMTAYFDGTVIAGTYYYNGSGGLKSVPSPPQLSALDYGSVGSYGLNIGRNPSTGSFDFGAGCAAGACAIDDVRIYNRALSAAEISILSSGSQAGTFALSSPMSVSGAVDVQASGTLTLSGANAAITMANNQTLTVNGTLNSSTSAGTGPAIQCSSGTTSNRFHFYVGSITSATPTLNISNLTVRHTDLNGMRINGNASGNVTSATTTFKQFDGVTFKDGTASSSSGVAYLQIFAPTLYLTSHGCRFGVGETTTLPAAAVKLTGDGFSNGATETRAIFGGTLCADGWTDGSADKICTSAAKSDNDSTSDGIGDSSSMNGAVVQFVRAAKIDINGTVEGLPTAAFDWSDFSYYSTYIAVHDADPSGTKDRVYVRTSDGTASSSTYYWEAPAGEAIVGTPRWSTSGSHYVYVALASGKVYQLVDDTGAGTLSTTGAAWSTNPNTGASTITTPLYSDTSNLYYGGTVSGNNRVFAIRQSTGVALTGSPYTVGAAVTSATPAVWANGGVTYFTLGVETSNTRITHTDINNSMTTFSNTVPSGSITGRIGYATKVNPTLFVGDDEGHMYGITPTNSSNAARWTYSVSATTTISPSYYDYTGDTLMFGTTAGKLYSLSAATGTTAAAMTGYTSGYTPNSNADPFSGAPLYSNGILVAGNVGSATRGGRLYIIDRNSTGSAPCTASGPNLLRQYNFGPSVTVSGVGYDGGNSHYMVTTSSSISDGTLYYIDRVTDPTNSCN